jgi:hypothetical protein
MISRNALYSFIETIVGAALDGSPLHGAESFRNLRSPVDETTKVIRVECFVGQHVMTTETVRKEANVRFTVQCWVTPESGEQTDIDAAVDESFDMSRILFEAIASDTSLSGGVCDAYCDEFETGEANLGTIRRGVTFLDGLINRAGA